MHRTLPMALLSAVLLSVIGAGTAHAAEPIMPLAEVRPGLTCEASSVIAGTTPVSFGAEVISVEGGPLAADAVIVMRFSGAAIANTGIGQGFSGSPVRCQDGGGTWRVIGAIALGIGQYDNFVGGVRPIEAMLATPTWAAGPSIPTLGEAATKAVAKRAAATTKTSTTKKTSTSKATSTTAITPAQAWQQGKPLLTLQGPRGALGTAIERAAAKVGIPLVTTPSATRLQTTASVPLVAGDAVAASVVTGDVSLGAIGTVTYVDGDKVWAFGHQFSGSGPSRLLMSKASISTVIASPAIGDQVSYKLGSPIAPAGTVGFDGSAAIGGVLGATPATIPVRATVRDGAGKVLQTATSQIVDERAVRGANLPQYLALLAGANAGTALQRLSTSSGVGGAARACVKIWLKGESKPLNQCIDSIVESPSGAGVETSVVGAVSSSVGPVLSAERFQRLIQSVDVDVTYRNEADTATIVRVRQPRNVRAGTTITVRAVVIQGSTGERREVPLKLRVPRGAKGQRTAIVVTGSLNGGSSALPPGVIEIILEGGGDGGPPKNLAALRALYTADGLSGLRAAVVPGISGDQLLRLLDDSEGGGGELSDEEYDALLGAVKMKHELPTVALDGAAAVTVRPR